MTKIFRFRDIRKLFEHQELENQEIHFSSLENLNDPMEGYLNLFFQGDRVAWENLFFHYIVCIDDTYCCANYGIDIFAKDHTFPLENYDNGYFSGEYGASRRDICEKSHEKFIGIKGIEDFITFVASGQKVSMLEMNEYLKFLNLMAIHCYIEHCLAIGFIKEKSENSAKGESIIRNSMKAVAERFGAILSEWIDKKSSQSQDEFLEYLVQKQSNDNYNDIDYLVGLHDCSISKNNIFLFRDFPSNFLNQIKSLLWNPHYIACFSTEATNPTLWAHYANSHKGVCLIFNAHDNKLHLKTATSIGGAKDHISIGYDDVEYPLHSVRYEPSYPEVDFFKNIATITHPQFSKYWCSGKSGASNCFNEYFGNKTRWIHEHYRMHEEIMTTKLKDWEYEKEVRMIYGNNIVDTGIPRNRSLQYSFECLEGMIFGINTSPSDKLKIIEIIRGKCKKHNRKEFNFFQAFYDGNRDRGHIRNYPLMFTP